MIDGYWSDVHGIFYPDGTVRDPSIPAAVLGFRRKRDEGMVYPNANKEGYAQRGISMVKEALEEKTKVFRAGRKSIDEVLEAAEFCANLLEACLCTIRQRHVLRGSVRPGMKGRPGSWLMNWLCCCRKNACFCNGQEWKYKGEG